MREETHSSSAKSATTRRAIVWVFIAFLIVGVVAAIILAFGWIIHDDLVRAYENNKYHKEKTHAYGDADVVDQGDTTEQVDTNSAQEMRDVNDMTPCVIN